jgi:putative ABC transport system permease protein
VFTSSDGEPGNERVVILSHAVWQEWFGGRRNVVSETINLARRSYTIVGVMPPGVYPAWPVNPATVTLDPDSRRLWVPIARTPQFFAGARGHTYGVVGRLAPGVSMTDAERELTRLAERTEPDLHGAVLRPFRDQFVRDARTPLLALLGAALAVLLLACTNLAAVQGAAIEGRRAELGVRAALGAGRLRLARQFATEGAMLAGAAAVAGLVVAKVALVRIPDLLPPSVPLLTPPSVDLTSVAIAALASVAAALALAAWPLARTAGAVSPAPRGVVSIARSPVFRFLVVAQVAIAVCLVACAALLQQSLDTVRHKDAGFVVDRVLVGDLTLAGAAYNSAPRIVAAERRLTSELARLPGARAVAFAYDHPLEANWSGSFTVAGSAGRPEEAAQRAELRIVSPGYFDAMGVAVLDGRSLTERDELGAAGAVLVNEAFARQLGGPVLNRIIRSDVPRLNWPDSGVPSEFTIVGMVEDERFKGLERPSSAAVYMTTRQFPQGQLALLIRTDAQPEALAQPAREMVRRFDPQLPFGRISSLSGILAEQLVTRRATTHAIDGFAVGSLSLAALGLYGLLALLVSARTRETGIRLALGSSPRLEAWRVARECVVSAAAGVAGGIALALLGGRLVQSLLVGVSPRDPATLAAVCMAMLIVAAAAALLPAWRAARVDPATVLRGDA